MFNILPEKIAVKALHEVLKISMDTLTVRYCQLEPASKRLTQYRDACDTRPTQTFHKPPPHSVVVVTSVDILLDSTRSTEIFS